MIASGASVWQANEARTRIDQGLALRQAVFRQKSIVSYNGLRCGLPICCKLRGSRSIFAPTKP